MSKSMIKNQSSKINQRSWTIVVILIPSWSQSDNIDCQGLAKSIDGISNKFQQCRLRWDFPYAFECQQSFRRYFHIGWRRCFSCQLPVYDQSKDRNSSNISLYSWFLWFNKASLRSLKAKFPTVPFIDWCQCWTSQWSETWAVQCGTSPLIKTHIFLLSKLEPKGRVLQFFYSWIWPVGHKKVWE